LNKLGRIDESKASLDQVIQLTEMNQNTAERAQNYALMAALYDRQLHDTDSAMLYLDQAITLNPDNPSFYVQKGDMYAASGDYNDASTQYDKAMSHGLNELDGYIIKSETGLKAMEKKYGTSKAQELRDKMTEDEKSRVCGDLTKALELGWKDMNKDMFAALVCK
jgi:tetratricopeptide (TPR) repeat protein